MSGGYHHRDRDSSKDSRYRDSRRRERSRSRSPHERQAKKAKGESAASRNEKAPSRSLEVKEVALDAELSAEEIQMMMAMGIPFGFDSTQGKHVDDKASNQGAVKVATKRSARQYMNRKGGFNKALPAERTGEKVHIEGYARR